MSMTVKSRVAYQEALSELKLFKPGEQVWIVWSGFLNSELYAIPTIIGQP